MYFIVPYYWESSPAFKETDKTPSLANWQNSHPNSASRTGNGCLSLWWHIHITISTSDNTYGTLYQFKKTEKKTYILIFAYIQYFTWMPFLPLEKILSLGKDSSAIYRSEASSANSCSLCAEVLTGGIFQSHTDSSNNRLRLNFKICKLQSLDDFVRNQLQMQIMPPSNFQRRWECAYTLKYAEHSEIWRLTQEFRCNLSFCVLLDWTTEQPKAFWVQRGHT